MWIYTDFASMHSLSLQVKRRVYINSLTERNNPDFKQVRMGLPHKKKAHYLYEYELTEIEFQEKSFILNNALADPNIEGIYETKIPIEIKAILALGCVIRPKAEKLDRIAQSASAISGHVFSVDELEVKADPRYLSEISALHQFHISHIQMGKRGLWMLFVPSSMKVHVFIVLPGTHESPSMQKYVRSVLNSIEWDCVTQYPKNNKQTLRVINKILGDERPANSIAVVASPLATHSLISEGLDTLIREIPVIRRHSDLLVLSALDWQREGIGKLCTFYLEAESDLREKVNLARYGSIPVGNLPEDPMLFLCDILFSRSLSSSRNILWWSDEVLPDMGGEDTSDQILTERDFYSEEQISPGLYSYISIEFDLGLLPTNAIICYKHLFTGELIEDNPDDERVICLDSFRRIRGMICTWVEDVKKYNNEVADKLVIHSYR